jgi:hypothetical protein
MRLTAWPERAPAAAYISAARDVTDYVLDTGACAWMSASGMRYQCLARGDLRQFTPEFDEAATEVVYGLDGAINDHRVPGPLRRDAACRCTEAWSAACRISEADHRAD